MEYQGWANYQTWCVSLWLHNDEGLYTRARELAQEHGDTYTLSSALYEWVSELAPDLGPTMWTDLLCAALQAVNWEEIAISLLSEDR